MLKLNYSQVLESQTFVILKESFALFNSTVFFYTDLFVELHNAILLNSLLSKESESIV